MILLSFDVEEFDVPDEFGFPLPFAEQIEISRTGTVRILDTLLAHQVKATFFITVNFARHAPEVLQRIVNEGHELGSHGVYHSRFSEEDLLASRLELEAMSGHPVRGYRMPRMMPVNEKAVGEAGYTYNSSLNPTWLPGRYNNFTKPRTYFLDQDVWQIPASVTPWVRIPLFWITFHVLPMGLYIWLCRWTLKKDKYLNLYFHPWEFVDLKNNDQFKLPFYITKNSGEALVNRLDQLIRFFKPRTEFARTDEMPLERTSV